MNNLNDLNNNIPTRSPSISFDLTKKPNATENQSTRNKLDEALENKNTNNNFEEINIENFFPRRKVEKQVDPDDPMLLLDQAVARTKVDISNNISSIINKQNEEMEKIEEEKEFKEIDSMIDGSSITKNKSNNADDDFNDELGDYASEPDDDVRNIYVHTHIEDQSQENITTNTIHEPEATVVDNEHNNINTVEETKDEENTNTIPTLKNTVNILDGVDNDELFDENDEEDVEIIDEDERLELLKQEVKEKIVTNKTALDFSKFRISQKPISPNKAVFLKTPEYTTDWVLYSAKKPITVTGLSGPEILKLNPSNSSRNRLNTFKDIYRVIYDHIVDENKPDFDLWLRQTRFSDIPHIYFALYKATFHGSNFLTFSCPICKKLFISNIDFNDMVEFKDDEVKANFNRYMQADTNSISNDTYESDLVQISDNYAFGLRYPSIWNVSIEIASLSDQFIEKYSDLIDIVSYIDKIYMIDRNNNMLIPIDTKPVKNDQPKTSARRIKIFYDIISTLNSEDFYKLRGAISKYDEDSDAVTYKYPEIACSECGEKIQETKNVDPSEMLFTRHQLAAIRNM